ncbi:hypothetical protein ENKNEFLB_03396 [Nocardioides aquaticus]|uniref:DUF5130 family protein n=1 Tax=Nocardioides aquaticus TaxID=160826 RepID=A0ABX8EP77_9ACTN|nr:hypothetical protein ENKNEFLB_03396 [Nocardioides aquaticus]
MPVPAGDRSSHLTGADRTLLDDTIRRAEQACRAEISVFVGTAEGGARAFATSLHNSLVAPSRSILVMVDPTARALEIVTGGWVRRHLSDKQVELVALTMQSAFAEGDLVGGLRRGVTMLGEHARAPRTLHSSTED